MKGMGIKMVSKLQERMHVDIKNKGNIIMYHILYLL